MKISAIKQTFKQNYKNQSSKKIKNINSSNNFNFSNISSNAIKANALSNISFGAQKKITQADVIKKETQVRLEAIKAHAKLQNVYYLLAPQWLKDSQELYSMAQEDLADITSSKRKKDIVITQEGFIKLDSLKRPLYTVNIKDGKITKIFINNINDEKRIDAVIEINTQQNAVASYQQGYDFNGDYDFKMDYFCNQDRIITPDIYRKGRQKDEDDNSNYDEVMLFGGSEMTYRLNVQKCDNISDPNGKVEDVEFNFQDMNNYSYRKGYSATDGKKPTKSGEYVLINDSRLTYWDMGCETYPDGTKIQLPKIEFKNGKVVEYDMGYKFNPQNSYLQRHNYIKEHCGISNDMLRALGYLK